MRKNGIISILLALCTILPACQSQKLPVDTAGADSDTTTVDDADNGLYANLPTGDYGETEFVFANETQSASWSILMLDCETITGDVLDNAVYHRNRTVEENLGITIKVVEYDHPDKLRDALVTNVMSGDDPYHVYDICANYTGALILQDYFVDVDVLELDISKPWWNKTVMDSLTFNDKCYSIAGDLSIMLWEASYCLIFNKDMAEKLGLPDQYQLVHDGKFTIDAVNEAMKLAYEDNGNTVVDTEDTFGMTGCNRLMTYSLISGGQSLMATDSDGLPVFDGVGDRMYEMYEKIFDVYFDNESVFIANRMKFNDASKSWHTLFTDGKALYYFEPIGANVKLRDSSFDFGFLPMPKYDESQENYITPILQFTHTMHVTKANSDIEMTGVVLENLAAESYRSVRSDYFEKVIEGKRSRDDGTIEMFDIIFDNQVMDPTTVFDWGGLAGALNDNAFNGTREISSKIASIENKIKTDIQKTTDYYS